MTKERFAAEFWSRVSVLDDGCWAYGDYSNTESYPEVADWNGAKRRVHVVAFELIYGEVPDGYDVHHKCRFKQCICPEHLEAKTPTEHQHEHNVGLLRETCKRGHVYAAVGFYSHLRHRPGKIPSVERICKVCHGIRMGRLKDKGNESKQRQSLDA